MRHMQHVAGMIAVTVMLALAALCGALHAVASVCLCLLVLLMKQATAH